MYLREIDYKVLKMMRDKTKDKESPYYYEKQLKDLLKEYAPTVSPEETIKYYRNQKLVDLYRDIDGTAPFVNDIDRCLIITVLGEASIEEYELEQRSKLILPEEANKISIEANQIANSANSIASKANSKSIVANVLSIISIVLVMLDIVLRILKII